MEKDITQNYIRKAQHDREYKQYSWDTAIGLQDVDGIKTSSYLYDLAKKQIDGDISIEDVAKHIRSYYSEKEIHQNREEEADIVSANIARLLQEDTFVFSVAQLITIRKRLFDGVYSHAGKIRDFNISKAEWILDGDSVQYGNSLELMQLLEYDIEQEKNFSYKGLSIDETIRHLARFTANLWQIHPFAEGNTRTVAVFLIKYLKTMGFDVTNDTFAKNSWYFRNALVRANYTNIPKGVFETTKYLEMVLKNLIQNKENVLENRELRVEEELVSYSARSVGRPILVLPENWDDVILQWKNGIISAQDAMKATNMKRTSFYKYVKKFD